MIDNHEDGLNRIAYPRVLIVYLSRINNADQHGISLRAWFGSWPRECLAQIYSGNENDSGAFCGASFKIGSEERRLGNLFMRMRRSSLGESAQPLLVNSATSQTINPADQKTATLRRIGSLALHSGLWELIFAPRLSSRLRQWIQDFRPDIVYCQGYTLSFVRLPLLIADEFSLPICFQTGDDWPEYLYADSVLKPVMRPIARRETRRLVDCARVRFANGPRMAEVYNARYRQPFDFLMMADSLERFRAAEPVRLFGPDTFSIVYSGTLAHRRWESLVDLADAARSLRPEGLNIRITAFASLVPPEAIGPLQDRSNLRILPPPAHDETPGLFRGADLLFLPETFNPAEAEKIRLSISTKAHLYMLSERPVLAYGSPAAGVIDYALQDGWAYVVDARDPGLLRLALRDLVSNDTLRRSLIERAAQVALRNHETREVQQYFLTKLQKACEAGNLRHDP